MLISHELSNTIAQSDTDHSDSDSSTDLNNPVRAIRPHSLFQYEDTFQGRTQSTGRHSSAQRYFGRQDRLDTTQTDISTRSGMRNSRDADESIRLVDYQRAVDDGVSDHTNNGSYRGRGSRESGLQPGSSGDDAPLLPHDSTGRNSLKGHRRGFWPRLGAWFSSHSSRLSSQRYRSTSKPYTDVSEDHDPTATRTISVGHAQITKYPANVVSNAKYTPWTFLPVTLYNEFSFFLNLYFLLVALSQIIPALRIGYLSTYIAPLVFVLSITLGKEAMDDLGRRRRDAEANGEGYTVLMPRREKSGRKSRIRRLRSTQRETVLLQEHARDDTGTMQKKRLLEAGMEDPGGGPNARFKQARPFCEVVRKSRDLMVGDIVKLRKGQRVPADVVILGSYANEVSGASPASAHEPAAVGTEVPDLLEATESTENQGDANATAPVDSNSALEDDSHSAGTGLAGETFIRTDQLDGETDWKLRLASPLTQALAVNDLTKVEIVAGKPERSISRFIGTIQISNAPDHDVEQDISALHGDSGSMNSTKTGNPRAMSAPLTVDNTAWANTVIASNSITLAAVIYTGPQTRQAMSTSQSRSKTGLLEYEINSLTKILCLLTLSLSVILVVLERIESTENRKWYITVMRFLILFSTIIPISLRVNLDMGKSVYSWFIEKDEGIKGAIVRTSTIPEELGRIEYLLSDKTGTLTQNGI